MKDLKEDNKVTNLDYLMGLAKGDERFVKEMIRIFLEENPKEVFTLKNSIEEKDYDAMRLAAHKLKSSIPFVGLDKKIGEELYDIENKALNEPDMARIKRQFKKIKDTCEQARAELDVLDR